MKVLALHFGTNDGDPVVYEPTETRLFATAQLLQDALASEVNLWYLDARAANRHDPVKLKKIEDDFVTYCTTSPGTLQWHNAVWDLAAANGEAVKITMHEVEV